MRWVFLTATTVVVAAFVLVTGGPGFAARPGCLVSNERTDVGARSLQAAVDAAAPGDRLIVKGRCVGASVVTKDLVLLGVSNPAFGTATLDGAGSATVLTVGQIGGPVDVVVERLTITNGVGMGGGVYNRNIGGSLVLRETIVVANTSTSNGGGGIFNAGSLALVDSVVADNTSTTGTAGGYGGGGIRNQVGSIELLRSQVTGNSANAAGGGIYTVHDGTITVTESTVSGNVAGTRGGGIDGESATVTVTRSTVSDNTAPAGAGIASGGWYWFPATVTVIDSTIAGNSAVGPAQGGSGGGILSGLNGTVTIAGTTISGNTALGVGGGIANWGRALTITDSVLEGNAGSWGGGLHNADATSLGGPFPGTAMLLDVTFRHNTATMAGGGIYNNGTLHRTNVTFAGNVPDDCSGGCA